MAADLGTWTGAGLSPVSIRSLGYYLLASDLESGVETEW
jgi:hypothetical protein